MNIDWKLVASSLGLVLVIEGIPYFLFAEKMPQTLRTLASIRPGVLRAMGLVAMLAGLALAWLARAWS